MVQASPTRMLPLTLHPVNTIKIPPRRTNPFVKRRCMVLAEADEVMAIVSQQEVSQQPDGQSPRPQPNRILMNRFHSEPALTA